MCKREEFLEPETRCDTYISAEKKQVWKCMLDMLEEFIRVCKKYNFTYYAMGGTMLGAARHQGMIPWDDDIDVMMPRKDYDKIQEVLQKELPSHMFLQSTLTDPQYMNPHFKIRDCRTSGIDMTYVRLGIKFNFGIFLDVFPLDGVPNDQRLYDRQLKRFCKIKRMEWSTYTNQVGTLRLYVKHLYCWWLFHLMGRRQFFRWRERFFSKFRLEDCREWVAAAANFTYTSRYRWPAWCFEGGTIELPFEYLTVAVPVQYEKMLEITYGNWRKFVKGDAMHGGLILDAQVPYAKKLGELDSVRQKSSFLK